MTATSTALPALPEVSHPGISEATHFAPACTTSSKATRQAVLWSRRWTPALLSIRVTRDPAFRFTPGHYARMGIADASGKSVFRPLSIVSAPGEPWLEFFCTLVPDGEFSIRLAELRVDCEIEVDKASYGFLTVGSLAPGSDLWLLASGTGLAPFVSMLRDRAALQAFERIVVVHSVRRVAELAYADEIRQLEQEEAGRARLRYLPIVTREPGATPLAERIPALLAGGGLDRATGMTLDPERSRVMVCGNPELTRELRTMLGERGFRTSRRAAPGQVAFEKYW